MVFGMKSEKGFTLIELIVIIVIIGVILVFTLPNITSVLERNKKEQMIADAKDMVDKAKNKMIKTADYPTGPTGSGCKPFKLKEIDEREEIKTSPYGNSYDRTSSTVLICLESEQYKYRITLKDGSHKIVNVELGQLSIDKVN